MKFNYKKVIKQNLIILSVIFTFILTSSFSVYGATPSGGAKPNVSTDTNTNTNQQSQLSSFEPLKGNEVNLDGDIMKVNAFDNNSVTIDGTQYTPDENNNITLNNNNSCNFDSFLNFLTSNDYNDGSQDTVKSNPHQYDTLIGALHISDLLDTLGVFDKLGISKDSFDDFVSKKALFFEDKSALLLEDTSSLFLQDKNSLFSLFGGEDSALNQGNVFGAYQSFQDQQDDEMENLIEEEINTEYANISDLIEEELREAAQSASDAFNLENNETIITKEILQYNLEQMTQQETIYQNFTPDVFKTN